MINIQLGNYSNFVGTQILNLQAAADPIESAPPSSSSLWRETRKGFTPRVVIVDSKENTTREEKSSPLNERETHKAKSESGGLWGGRIDVIQQNEDETSATASPPLPPPRAGGSGSSAARAKVKVKDTRDLKWSEVTRWTLNPDSLYTLPSNSYNSESGVLSSFGQGLQVSKVMENELEDGIRRYAEEVDSLKGFLILADQLDGYSGLCSGTLGHIVDEYEKKCSLCFTLVPPVPPTTTSNERDRAQGKNSRSFKTRMTNVALLWNSCYTSASLFSSVGLAQDICIPEFQPLNIPYLRYKTDSHFESSGIIASVLETLLSPALRLDSVISPSGLAAYLSAFNRKFVSISSSLPFPYDVRSGSFFKCLQSSGLDSLVSFTPGISLDLEKATGNYFSLRGIPNSSTISDSERRSISSRSGEIRDPESCLMTLASELYSRSVNLVHGVETPLTICDPFPKVIEERALNSFHLSKKYSNGVVSSWDLSCLSSAQNSVEVGVLLEKVLDEVPGHSRREGKVTQTLPSADDLGIEMDDYLEAIDNLNTLRDAYRPSMD